MRKIVTYLFSILLLFTVLAKASYTIPTTNSFSTIAKPLENDQKEKIDIEEEERSAYDQLKNNEFMYTYNHHCFAIESYTLVFPNFIANIPHSYLEMPERPPKHQVI